ncbi:hypothetical protein LTR08_006943 [Meristemomyces frigidus]|nr:hypothetical protein LTR08_006943 [Meristemomyces frigidus]
MSSKASRREEIRDAERADVPILPLLAIKGYLCFRCLKHTDDLVRCRDCERALYCSVECQIADYHMAHREHCKAFQLVNLTDRESSIGITWHTDEQCSYYSLLGELEIFKLSYFEAHTTVSATVTPSRAKPAGYEPSLSTTEGWLDYYRRISEKRNIGSFIATDFSFDPVDRAMDAGAARERWRHLLLATDGLTMPLTILAALEDSVPDILSKDTLVLHIVGAAGKEFQSLALYEEILHLLPTVKHLEMVLAGPESPGASAGQTGDHGQVIELDCCSTCTGAGRHRTVTSFQGGYHEYAARPAYTKPDLAVLFHSGRSQAYVEEWKPTTRFLVESGTKTLCTTYTEREAREETVELDQVGARFTVRPEVNKWRGLAPLPELIDGPEHTAYYNNYYRYIFQGKGPLKNEG